MNLDALKARVVAVIDSELAAPMLSLSADLHAHPEIAFQEHRSAAAIATILDAHGQAPNIGTGGLPTAFDVRTGSDGPTVAILAEYDALPGLGHACGHNVIAASAVGAYLALASLGPLPGSIRLIGTPAEEDGGGKVMLHDAGVFAGVDAAMMIHPFDETFPLVEFAGRIPLTVVFHGLAAHAGSMPEHGISALDAAIVFLTGLNAMRQRLRDGARFHGIIAEGGTSPGIVPERARVELYLRAYDQAYLNEFAKMVTEAAHGAAHQTGTGVDVTSTTAVFQSFVCNRPLAAAASANLASVGAEPRPEFNRAFAATDFGNLSQTIPSIHPYVGMGTGLVCHTPAFAEAAGDRRGRQVALQGAKAMAMTTLDFLFNPSLSEAIEKERH